MQVNDVVNGMFECVGGVLLWGSVRKLWEDREVKGVYWPAWLFYGVWGVWNLVYYPSLDQWCGFVGGLVVTTANITWVVSYLLIRRCRSPCVHVPDLGEMLAQYADEETR
jgi:hypothetical protein